MRVPFSWLREYCDPGIEPEEVADLLSARSVEVERITRVGAPAPEGFVVGIVTSAQKHPDADRLSVCEVDTGDGTRTIVCGAPNVAAGQAVPVALPGAVLADGTKLSKAKLRGVESDGMILSEVELELGDDADGIIVLDDGAPAAGAPLQDVAAISDVVFELDVSPNRPDLLGVYGVAREVHAITGAPLAPPPWDDDAPARGDAEVTELASVTVEVPELCPRFTARVFTGIETPRSPLWLRARLLAAGQRPISSVVDVTNYVMLAMAQPLHAFDLDRVPGGELIVRAASDGERMTTLDGVERRFDAETVLVCDRNGPSGIAGIMGGQASEVSETTTGVLLEVATWNGVNILRTASMLGLRTEASTRFEKQLHPELAMRAQRFASRLLVDELGADLAPGTIDVATEPPSTHVISVPGTRVNGLLGVEIDQGESETHLTRLGFDIEADGDDPLRVTVPPERHYDVVREADVIEEIARLHGVDRLPRRLPAHGERGGLTADQAIRRQVEDLMRDIGFDQIVSWSFVAPDVADRLPLPEGDARRPAIALGNPLSEDQSVMRTSLLGGLLDAARHNLARHAERLALFESARVYLPETAPEAGGPVAGAFPGHLAPPLREPQRLGCLVIGPLRPPSWREGGEPAGFFELKGVLEDLCAQLDAALETLPADEPFLTPGRAARIEIAGNAAGWVGEIHPLVARAWDLSGGAAFELDLAPLVAAASGAHRRYEDVTTNPALYEDVAVVVPEEIPVETVRRAVVEGGGELLRSARPFDLYRGEQIGPGRKSLALRLEFRAPDRTLTDGEVAELRKTIREALEEIGGALRE